MHSSVVWTIWSHGNLVTHEDKNPNPLEVIKTAQKFFCRYKEAFNMEGNQGKKSTSTNSVSQSMGGHWDLIIKISGAKARRSRRSGLAYEAITPQGLTIFKGGASCAAAIAVEATQEALVEAVLIAKTFGFVRILFLSSRKGKVKACNLKCSNGWKDSTMVADIVALQQQNFVCKAVFVPSVIISPVHRLASLATKNPGHHSWMHPTLL